MAKRVEAKVVKTTEEKQSSGNVKVILKCWYPKKDKDGKIVKDQDGKAIKLKPDTEISLPAKEANDLIGKAFAVKA